MALENYRSRLGRLSSMLAPGIALGLLSGCATHVANLPAELNPQPVAHQVRMPEGALQKGAITISNALWEKNQDEYLKRSAQDAFVVTSDSIQNDTSDWIARMAVHALEKIDLDAVYQ